MKKVVHIFPKAVNAGLRTRNGYVALEMPDRGNFFI